MFKSTNTVSAARLLTCLAGVALAAPAFGFGDLRGANIHSKNYNEGRSNTAANSVISFTGTRADGSTTGALWNFETDTLVEMPTMFGPNGQPYNTASAQFRQIQEPFDQFRQARSGGQPVKGISVGLNTNPSGPTQHHAISVDTTGGAPGIAQEFTVPLGFASSATGLNIDGSVVSGTIYGNVAGIGPSRQAVQWINGSMQTLSIDPRYRASEARAVSLSGDRIVGNVSDVAVPELATSVRSKAAVWVNGAARVLENTSPDMFASFIGISDNGGMAYATISSTRSNAKGGMIYDIDTNTSTSIDFDYNGDGAVDLFDMDLGITQLSSISGDGSILGGSTALIGGPETATLWLRQGNFGLNYTNIDALSYFSSLGVSGLTGWNLTSVTAVSADGLIFSGNGINAAGVNDIWVATVPTPGALILGSFGTLLAIRRRR